MCAFNLRFDKGFTLIEILISLALAGIIISIILSMLGSNVSIFHDNDKDIELQQQGQFIISFLEEKIIESCGITYIQDENGVIKSETNDKVNLKKIIVKNSPEATDNGYIFQLSKASDNTYNLKYGIGLFGSASVEVGNYIEKIEVEPFPLEKIYTEARGINLTIYLRFDRQNKVYSTQFFFRNNHWR